MLEVTADNYCFACGPANPHGLHLSGFVLDGDVYRFEYTPEPHHQGWQGIVHGGIIATVLDEAMTRLLWETGRPAVTAKICIRYRRPLPVGTRTRVRAWVVQERHGLVTTRAVVEDDDGEYASAEALFMRTRGRQA